MEQFEPLKEVLKQVWSKKTGVPKKPPRVVLSAGLTGAVYSGW